ncbi:uncharacterized protein LOC142165096 [Nicotiana tabacum]|uniref:Uncharacterized protein LOC142165096 n=1 Tax=Nicotiana tabacum TaxID=4097 RepID=A0AC58S4B4_TOBAC
MPNYVQNCDKCQCYTPLVHQPAEPLHSVLSPWWFMKWGMDIVKHYHHPLLRFGIPEEIASDNGPQFTGAKVTKFLEDLKIKKITSSPDHPSTNGQATSTNKVIIQNLNKRLEAAKDGKNTHNISSHSSMWPLLSGLEAKVEPEAEPEAELTLEIKQ